MTGVITSSFLENAAVVVGLPVLVGYLTAVAALAASRVAEIANGRRVRYAEAVQALVAWIEFPYRVRRRTSDEPTVFADLARLGHDLQERLAFQQAWIGTESHRVARAYVIARTAIDHDVRPALTDAWSCPPATKAADMVLGSWGPGPSSRHAIAALQVQISTRFGLKRIFKSRVGRTALAKATETQETATAPTLAATRDAGLASMNWVQIGLTSLAIVNVLFIVVAFRTSWVSVERGVTSTSDYDNARLQTMLTPANLVFTSVLAWLTGFYAWLTRKLVTEAQLESHERSDERRRHQAELIGAYIGRSSGGSGKDVVILHVVNASPLPVRAVRGWLVDAITDDVIEQFNKIVCRPVRKP